MPSPVSSLQSSGDLRQVAVEFTRPLQHWVVTGSLHDHGLKVRRHSAIALNVGRPQVAVDGSDRDAGVSECRGPLVTGQALHHVRDDLGRSRAHASRGQSRSSLCV